jgi:hypothetical protein
MIATYLAGYLIETTPTGYIAHFTRNGIKISQSIPLKDMLDHYLQGNIQHLLSIINKFDQQQFQDPEVQQIIHAMSMDDILQGNQLETASQISLFQHQLIIDAYNIVYHTNITSQELI